MRFKTTTWILLLVLAAVAAYFFLVDEQKRKARDSERRSGNELFSYARADVERFVLINPSGERIEVAKRGSTWGVVSPVEAPGDQPEIASFLDQIVPGRKGIELAEPKSLADYGLEKPFATLILYRTGAATGDTLFVGDATPTSSNRYVRVGSAGSVLISSVITHRLMNKGLLHLRDKNFLPPGTDSITALSIRSGHRSLELARRGASWWITPRNVRANRVLIETYLTKLTDAVIHRFVQEDTKNCAPYGLKDPAGEITLTKGQEKVIISFGKEEDRLVHVTRTGLDKVIMIEASLLEPFEWNERTIRAMNLAFINEGSVQAMRYETSDTAVVFTKTAETWSIAGAPGATARSWEVNGLLNRLKSTTFTEITAEPLSPDDRRLARFLIRVTLEDGSGAMIDRITISSPAAGMEIGASISASALGKLPPGTADGLIEIFKRIGARR